MLEINEKTYGSINPAVATIKNNIGQILRAKGDLEGALSYTQQALEILQATYGPENPTTRGVAENLKLIEQAKQATLH